MACLRGFGTLYSVIMCMRESERYHTLVLQTDPSLALSIGVDADTIWPSKFLNTKGGPMCTEGSVLYL